MKITKNTQQAAQSLLQAHWPSVTAMLCIFAVVLSALSARAGNILSNPGFETFFNGWSAHSAQSWSYGASTALVRTGNGSLWMQGLYLSGSAPHYNMYVYQTIGCAPGSTFTADAWFSQYVLDKNHQGGDNGAGSGLFTSDVAGQEDGWVEVMFLDVSNNVLADYKSTILTPAVVSALATAGATETNSSGTNLLWIDCQVTNQYDVSTIGGYNASIDPAAGTETITNTVGSGQDMVAPPGTKNVQFRLAISQAQYESGASYWDDCTLVLVFGAAPSVISGLSPDGSQFFNIAATNFTFNVASSSAGGAPLPSNPNSGIKISVNGIDQSASLQFSGNSTNLNVTYPNITSNVVYNISITVSNSAGLTSSSSVAFDTFGTNNFIVEAEDYDYGGGQYIQNPIPTSTPNTNSYFGRSGTLGIDISTYGGGGVLPGGSTSLAPAYPDRTDTNVAFQVATDLQLPLYSAQNDPGVYNVNLSYNNGGNWENYTRVYPAGNYLVYARISGGGGAGVEYLNLVTSGYGTTTITTNNLGGFRLANGTDWGHYFWIPLTDGYGNPVTVSLPAGQQTLQLFSGAGENVIDFMLVPFSGTLIPPAIANVNIPTPNVFQHGYTNLTFTVKSTTSTIASGNIFTFFNGFSAPESFSGNSTNWTVSVAVPQNELLNLAINATDNTGFSNLFTATFDTFTQSNLMVEAEDFDFAGGHFIDNPVPTAGSVPAAGSYYYYPDNNTTNLAITNVDLTTPANDAGEMFAYRPAESCGTETNTDFVRAKFVNANGVGVNAYDCDVGWWNGGTWLNYSRTFPANTYYVYGRLAGGAGPFSGTTLSLVTSGVGTSNQTTQVLGSFADPNAAGWQTWHWVPLLNSSGQPTQVSLSGVQTVRATSGGGLNANFYMFVPVAPLGPLSASVSGGSIHLSFQTASGFNYTVLYKNALTDPFWQTLATVPGNGAVQSMADSTSRKQRFYMMTAAGQ